MRLQKISIPTPWKVIENSEGEGVSKAKIIKGKYEAELEIPGGWGFKRNNFPGGMDIFCNHTFCPVHTVEPLYRRNVDSEMEQMNYNWHALERMVPNRAPPWS